MYALYSLDGGDGKASKLVFDPFYMLHLNIFDLKSASKIHFRRVVSIFEEFLAALKLRQPDLVCGRALF